MQTVSKFIINRDDNKFLYVEKCKLSKKSDQMKYFVHSSPKDVVIYSDHTFHSVHSLDEKMSVNLFSKMAADSLLTELYNEKNQAGYSLLMEVYQKTNLDSDKHNPNMKRIKNKLLTGLKIYNDIFIDFKNFEIPYEENYKLVNGNSEEFYVRQRVKSISSLVNQKEIEQNKQVIYSIPMKELVRTKKSA